MKRHSIIIDKTAHGERLDIALTRSELGLSRRKIRSIIDVGGVFVNRKRIRVASRIVSAGDRVELEYDPRVLSKNLRSHFVLTSADILFDSDNVVAINKPPGLPSQETRSQSILHAKTCLEAFFKNSSMKVPHLFLVHRLDKETSGVMLFAKSGETSQSLTGQFREHRIEKIYHAIVYGIPKKEHYRVTCNLSNIHPETGLVRILNSGGQSSETFFDVLSVNRKLFLALIACRPVSGRSHQIRVHLESLGLPIVGDKKYGIDLQRHPLPDELSHLTSEHHLLHAKSLSFQVLSDGRRISVEAPYPKNFLEFLTLTELCSEM